MVGLSSIPLTTLSPPEGGATVGPFTVISGGAAEVVARDREGREVSLVLGERGHVEQEAAALRALATRASAPAVLAVGEDKTHGAYLALDRRDVIATLRTRAATLGDRELVAMLRGLLQLVASVEELGFTWAPRLDDLAFDGTKMRALRLRDAERLGPHERIDARGLLESIGSALASETILFLPSAILHSLFPHRERGAEEERTVDALLVEIERGLPQLPLVGTDARTSAVTDIGLHRERNEDAFAIRDGEGFAIAVVSDGVSASFRADVASRIAVDTARDHIEEEIANEPAAPIVAAAIRAAHRAICAEHVRFGGEPLGTTVVAAKVVGRRFTIGWVGDSRAYFVGATGAQLLTEDHSWLNEAVGSGATTIEEAMTSPYAHALTRCLGPLEGGDPDIHAEPDVVDVTVDEPGFLVLCTDGLWNYYPAPEAIAAIALRNGNDASPAAVARLLVSAALAAGGQDNVTVAVVAID